jgi:glutathione S-transferase
MSYKLYYSPGACSLAAHTILNEIGAEFEAIATPTLTGATRSPEFLKLNPMGGIPVLVEDGKAMNEGGAIITYLCDKHNSPLLPKQGWERAEALRWLSFANATLHPAYGRTFWINKNLPEEQREAALKTARGQIQEYWDKIEAHLEGQGTAFLAGDKMTAGDILTAVIAGWNHQNYKFGPKTKAMFQAVSALPSFQKSLQTEGAEYKAAA